jgi:hypothetical protein
MILLLLSVNRSFSPTKDFQMNPDAVRNVERREKSKTPAEEIRDGVVTKEGPPNERCSLRFAILVAPIQWFLSNHPATNPFIAAIAINRKDNSINHY